MGKQLHVNQAAEREANEIAFRFMHSSDVVGDMSRTYGADLSAVRIHTDENAARKVEGTGADAFSTGKDVFFGRGVFDQGNPAGRGLLAHELAHSLQQGVGGGMEGAVEQSVPEGAEQGGKITDFFRRIFGRRRQEEEPMEVPAEVHGDLHDGDGFVNLDDPTAEGFDGYRIQSGSDTDTKQRFMTTQSRALYQMVQNAKPEQLRSDPMLRQMIMQDYQTNMAARLQGFEGASYDSMFSSIFRKDTIGEMSTFNTLLRASLPEGLTEELDESYNNGGDTDAALELAMQRISSSPETMEVLQAGMGGFAGSSHFSGEHENRQSEMMMNNLMLRAIAPGFTQKGVGMRHDYARAHGGNEEANYGGFLDLVNEAAGQGIGTNQIKRGAMLQASVKQGAKPLTASGNRFVRFLDRFRRR